MDNRSGGEAMVSKPSSRKPAKPTLAGVDAQWHRTFDAITDALCLVDPQGVVRRCNKAFATFVGRTPDAVVGEDCCALIHGGSDHPPGCPLPQALKTKAHQEGEYRLGERYVRVAVHPVLDETGTLTAAVPILSDISASRRAEDATRESEERYRHALDALPDPVFVKDEQHRWTILNDAFCRFMGYQREQLLGKSDFDFFPREEAEVFWAKDDEVFASAQENVNVENFTDSSGRQHVISTKKSVYRDSRTGKQILVGVIRDVTEANRVSEELHRYRDHLEDIVRERTKALEEANGRLMGEAEDRARAEELQAAIYEISEATQEVTNLEQLFVSIHHIVGRLMAARNLYIALYDAAENLVSFPYFVDEEDAPEPPRPPGRGLTEYILRTGQPLLATPEVFEDLCRRGEVESIGAPSIDWLGVPLIVGNQTIGALVVQTYRGGERYGEREKNILAFVSRQVALAIARKRAEEALRDSEAKYRTLVDKLQEGVVVVRNGKVLFANAALASMAGATVEEVVGRDLLEFIAPEDRSSFAERLRRRTEGAAGPFEYEVRGLHSDGVTRADLYVQAGEITYDGKSAVLATVRDLTERKRLEDQLRQAQKFEAIGQLAGGVAHDFNNLLMAIVGSTELLRQRLGAGGGDQELDAILYSARRASELTKGLLAFARRQVLETVALDLKEVVGQILPILRRVIPENIAIQFRPEDGDAIVRADRGQMDQILMNLAVNARDAMARGGTITITVGPTSLGEDYLVAHPWAQPGNFVRLAVADTGVGMDEATLSHVFEPFYTTKERGQGTGLGLAIVYGIVKQHGGMIEASSEPGEGTRFEIFLPAVARGASLVAPPEATAAPHGEETVLLVEDESEVRRILVAVLTGLGYRVLEAGDGVEALNLLARAEDQVDLVLSDVVMPQMGGRELFERARRLYPNLPFLFSSGYGDNLVDGDLAQDGHASYIGKPYTIDDLARKLRELLDRMRAIDSSSDPEAKE
ncbi:MAG: PAS domain S-box protein [Thermoanaerobaculales bacterium]